MTKWSLEKFKRNTVKLYDASSSPVFLVVIVATPNWVRASNVGMLTLKIFPGLLQKYDMTLEKSQRMKLCRDIKLKGGKISFSIIWKRCGFFYNCWNQKAIQTQANNCVTTKKSLKSKMSIISSKLNSRIFFL